MELKDKLLLQYESMSTFYSIVLNHIVHNVKKEIGWYG